VRECVCDSVLVCVCACVYVLVCVSACALNPSKTPCDGKSIALI